jgi:hypothetical protein
MEQYIRVQDELFLIKRTTGERYAQFAHIWNEMSSTHKTFKKDNRMYFCELIEEAQTIEENDINNQNLETND